VREITYHHSSIAVNFTSSTTKTLFLKTKKMDKKKNSHPWSFKRV